MSQFPRRRPIVLAIAIVTGVFAMCHGNEGVQRDRYGAIIRGDTSTNELALVFTGDEHFESAIPILDTLKQRDIKASFFVTGNFLRRTGAVQDDAQSLVRRIIADGHYMGPHSDSHPLYCDWQDRDKTLITREFFVADLNTNIAGLRAIGALTNGTPIYFIPPYEWYNRDHVEWSRQLGVTLMNFTPGSGSNRDYAPENDKRFVPSRKIYDDILAYEQEDEHGLHGFLLLLHLGSGRSDPFHTYLGRLCDELTGQGYHFVRVDHLLE